MNKEIGIYIHIPFCKKKCYYCDFVSYSEKDELWNDYVSAVIYEIKEISAKIDKEIEVNTVYIGGGTPSIINSKFIVEIVEEIMNNFKVQKNAEITIEVNPGTVNKEKLEDYKRSGINRLSIGLQSTNDNLLKQIGRVHCYSDFFKTYDIARNIRL